MKAKPKRVVFRCSAARHRALRAAARGQGLTVEQWLQRLTTEALKQHAARRPRPLALGSTVPWPMDDTPAFRSWSED